MSVAPALPDEAVGGSTGCGAVGAVAAGALAVGDGALGFWKARPKVWAATRPQRCWFHKAGNVLNKLPRAQQPEANRKLQEVWMAATKAEALTALELFAQTYQAKYPDAVECVLKDKDALLAFYDFPAEHWIHLRTTNPIESTFATVRLRQRVTKGPGSRAAGIAMAFKLIEAAQSRWRCVNAPHLVALVRAGATFVNGKLEQLILVNLVDLFRGEAEFTADWIAKNS